MVVTPEEGEPVTVGKGDPSTGSGHRLVTFPEGMDCTWKVRQPVRKHYRMG